MAALLVGPLVALAIGSILFTLLERRWPALPARWWRRRGHLTDLAYWFTLPLASKAGELLALVGVVVTALALGAPRDLSQMGAWLDARRTFVTELPPWLHLLAGLAVADLLGYWIHRAFHRGRLWRFHAVHHATRELDWMSSARNHPIADAAPKILQAATLVALGFKLRALGVLAPLVGLHAIFLHANVRWTFGPLRYVISTPAFHRWHHADDPRAIDKNFAGLFPVWDLLFGTFFLPHGEHPSVFGVREETPTGFLATLVWPFRRASARSALPTLRATA